jgi:hypothetical protein
MKIRPIHILSGMFWVNFVAVVWSLLFKVIPTGVNTVVFMVIFFLLAILTSTAAYQGGKNDPSRH